jgi:hypothetical protein
MQRVGSGDGLCLAVLSDLPTAASDTARAASHLQVAV